MFIIIMCKYRASGTNEEQVRTGVFTEAAGWKTGTVRQTAITTTAYTSIGGTTKSWYKSYK